MSPSKCGPKIMLVLSSSIFKMPSSLLVSEKLIILAICFLYIRFFASFTRGIGIFILLILFSRLKFPVVLSISVI
jgi:hypothetical protein